MVRGLSAAWTEQCQRLDDALNPVTARDLGILARKRVVAVSLLVAHGTAIVAFGMQLIVEHAISFGDPRVTFVHLLAAGITLLVVPALSGMALREPQAAVELVLMAGISARRIVFGRLLAVVLPGIMMLVSLLPYFLLNYFLGGAEPVADLVFVLTCLFGSVVLAAAAAAAASIPYVSALAGLIVGGCCFGVLMQSIMMVSMARFNPTWLFGAPVYLVLSAAPTLWFFNGLAASRCECRPSEVEGSLGVGMAAIFGTCVSLAAGSAEFGGWANLVMVVVMIVLTGVVAGIRNVVGSSWREFLGGRSGAIGN